MRVRSLAQDWMALVIRRVSDHYLEGTAGGA
jgi:hypothetical protein